MRRRMVIQVRRYGRYFLTLVGLIVVGSAAGFYVLSEQRLPNPFQSFYRVNGAFSAATAVVPGLGEPVNVAGVHVGQISGTALSEGQAIIHMQIDPSKIAHLYRDAHADLVPNTPLEDMQVDIAPGDPASGVLPSGGTISIAQTLTPGASDDLLNSLDADTRSWLVSLIAELNEGAAGRGKDLRALLSAIGPTTGQLKEVGDLLAARRQELAQIVHNLGVLTKATSEKDAQLATVVQASDSTIHALSSQDVALRQSIVRLPPTLATARTTLTDLGTFSQALGPTATALLPTARHLPSTLSESQTLFKSAALLPLNQIAPFISAVRPLAAVLPSLANDLRQEVPALTASFKVLAYATNEIAYDPGGKNPGFLYWLAWFAHNADSFISNSDANGPVWRALVVASCPALKSLTAGALLEHILGTNFGCK